MAMSYLNSINFNQNELQNARLQNLASAPLTPVEGQMYYNTVNKKAYIYANGSWADMTSTGNITSLTASAPIVTSGGSTPNLTLSPATSSTAGSLSAVDKAKLDTVAANANAYSHPNHSGDVTSAGDGVQTIGANKVTLPMMAQVATSTMLGRITAATGNVESLTPSLVRTLINVADGANNYTHPTGDGNLHIPATSTTNSGKVLTAGATAGSVSWVSPAITYSLPTATASVLGGVKVGGGLSINSGVLTADTPTAIMETHNNDTMQVWRGALVDYNNLVTYSNNTMYYITDDEGAPGGIYSISVGIVQGNFIDFYQNLGPTSGAIVIDGALGSSVKLALNGSSSINLTASASTSTSRTMDIMLSGGNLYTVAWGSNITWILGYAPALLPITKLSFTTYDNGVSWYGMAVGVGNTKAKSGGNTVVMPDGSEMWVE